MFSDHPPRRKESSLTAQRVSIINLMNIVRSSVIIVSGDKPTNNKRRIEHESTNNQGTRQQSGTGTHPHGLFGSYAKMLPNKLDNDHYTF
jgi:hypothetical protein